MYENKKIVAASIRRSVSTTSTSDKSLLHQEKKPSLLKRIVQGMSSVSRYIGRTSANNYSNQRY